jgi:hypothetical protein
VLQAAFGPDIYQRWRIRIGLEPLGGDAHVDEAYAHRGRSSGGKLTSPWAMTAPLDTRRVVSPASSGATRSMTAGDRHFKPNRFNPVGGLQTAKRGFDDQPGEARPIIPSVRTGPCESGQS